MKIQIRDYNSECFTILKSNRYTKRTVRSSQVSNSLISDTRLNKASPYKMRSQNTAENRMKPTERCKEKKGRGLTQPYDKSSYTNRSVKRSKRQHKNATKMSITLRLRTVSWSNYSPPTGVVNRFTVPTVLFPATAV